MPGRLEDLHELRSLCDRYAIAVDGRDADGLARLFVPGGALEVRVPGREEPVARLTGAAGFGRLVESLAVYAETMHLVHNHVATVDRDQATAVTYCVAHHLLAGDDPADEVLYVVYDDAFSRTAAGWRFERRVVRRLWTERVEGAGGGPLAVDRAMAAARRPDR